MKKISEKKLEAFTVGAMGKRMLSRKELEEQKKKEEETAAAHAFKEFVETFQEAPAPSAKVWVKAGTYDAGSRREDSREKGKLYKPTSKLEEKTAAERAQEYAKQLAADAKKDAMPLKKKNQEKKKSNLELFKEELRQIQEEREERHKFKHIAHSQTQAQTPAAPVGPTPAVSTLDVAADTRESGSFDNGDPNTTNLYLGNLNPKISEQQLMELFGRYGPLASIKIMWPRSEEEKQRGRNCGFVAYMSRKDAERALRTLNGRFIMGYEMRLGWGKSVPIVNQPIFIPPPLLELTLPPPPSGLPFNAQPLPADAEKLPKMNYKEYTTEEQKENMEQVLSKSVVKVFIPTEKTVLNLIHRTIEFVIREGPMFEALIMSREIENPLFSFLFDNESPAHIYYRWKLFSLLQGDTPGEWCEKEFRMFKGGAFWRPPIANFYTQGMSDDLVVDPDAPEVHKGALSTAQRDRLEDLIRHLTPERQRIGDAMIFCIEHADAADEISECIAESLANPKTSVSKKIARLYLLSDILHNCTVKVANASFFRKSIEKHLLEVFENLHTFFMCMESRLKAESVKSRVLKVVRAWEDWTIYSKEFLNKLKSVFLGIEIQPPPSPTPPEEKLADNQEEDDDHDDEDDIDGAPLSGDDKDDEDLDGVPLDGAALIKGALLRGLPDAMPLQKDTPTHRNVANSDDMDFDDIDGIPMDDDIDGIPLEKESVSGGNKAGGFIPSKWETVDPEQVEAQAITTSKWDTLEPPEPPKFYDSSASTDDEDVAASAAAEPEDGGSEENSRDFTEAKRAKLREIEVRTMQYQDELESGQRTLKPGVSMHQQVEHYRKKLLRKRQIEQQVDSPLSYLHARDTRRSESPVESVKKSRRSKRSPSPSARIETTLARRRSRSPTSSSYGASRDVSPTHSSRTGRHHSKRQRSRSRSESPKRYGSRSSSKYDSPLLNKSKSRRSPTPNYTPSRSKRSPDARSHRSDKHSKHKH